MKAKSTSDAKWLTNCVKNNMNRVSTIVASWATGFAWFPTNPDLILPPSDPSTAMAVGITDSFRSTTTIGVQRLDSSNTMTATCLAMLSRMTRLIWIANVPIWSMLDMVLMLGMDGFTIAKEPTPKAGCLTVDCLPLAVKFLKPNLKYTHWLNQLQNFEIKFHTPNYDYIGVLQLFKLSCYIFFDESMNLWVLITNSYSVLHYYIIQIKYLKQKFLFWYLQEH